MSFWETCFGSNKSLGAAVECNPALWNHLVLVEPTFFWGFQADIPYYLFRPALRVLRSWKMLLIKPRGEGGNRGLNAPQLPPAAKLSSPAQHASIWRGREGGYPHLCLCLWFLFLFFFSPGHRGGLLPEWADVGQSNTAVRHSSWGENLLWIKPRPQSGLVLILPLCAQSNWRGPDYRRYLWRLTAIWSQHSDTTFWRKLSLFRL